MVGHFNFGKQQLYFTKFYHISPCMTLRETFLGTSLQAVNGNSLTNCHQRWELRLSRMPSRTELHRSAVTDRPKWESELLVWPVQNDVFWCIFYLLNVFQCILVSILSMSCMCWRVPLLNPLWDVVGHFDSFASCSARKPLALATGKKKRRQPRLGRQLPMVSDSSYLNHCLPPSSSVKRMQGSGSCPSSRPSESQICHWRGWGWLRHHIKLALHPQVKTSGAPCRTVKLKWQVETCEILWDKCTQSTWPIAQPCPFGFRPCLGSSLSCWQSRLAGVPYKRGPRDPGQMA